ncbi:GMC oxidoreductase-domain-containing protein [Mycena leptocephala]|nr:GMC oxidoreductase-domain-containing protein [Mycena leptocephala]
MSKVELARMSSCLGFAFALPSMIGCKTRSKSQVSLWVGPEIHTQGHDFWVDSDFVLRKSWTCFQAEARSNTLIFLGRDARICSGLTLIPNSEDPYGGDVTGTWMASANLDPRSRTRSYAPTAYYMPNRERESLVVLTEAIVAHVFFADGPGQDLTATGVEFIHGGKALKVSAKKEVILSAGAIKSPQILELSGIGRKEILENIGRVVYEYIVNSAYINCEGCPDIVDGSERGCPPVAWSNCYSWQQAAAAGAIPVSRTGFSGNCRIWQPHIKLPRVDSFELMLSIGGR